jgi:signal transduction histidine kinase
VTVAGPSSTAPRLPLWPRSLATRTAVTLVAVLVVVQGAGLTIFGMDRNELQRLADGRDIGTQVSAAYRTMVTQPIETWPAVVRDMEPLPGLRLTLEGAFDGVAPGTASPSDQRLIRPYLGFGPVPQPLRPHTVHIRGAFEPGRVLLIGVQAPDDRWLVARVKEPPPRPWHSARFLLAFGIMTITAALVAFWAVRRLTAPLRVLGQAAERLGRDVNAPPLPETGPVEVAKAAVAFNTMAGRLRRFVHDRTFLLTAIGHDLKTPITRLKLRAEWMEDEEQRAKILADLDELEAMVQASLAFGRDVAGSEPAARLDLPALLRTVLDEASDLRPGSDTVVRYEGPDTLTIEARPVALKRAVANLVSNALAYGGAARLLLRPPQGGQVMVHVDDDGPGIPPEDMARVFEPFERLETSRNRETGGTGLGLPITRNIMRAHGGDVTLANRPGGGLRATLALPV